MLNKTTEQIQADVHALQKALSVPNLPLDEKTMHASLLSKLQLELGRRLNATTAHASSSKKQASSPGPTHGQQIDHPGTIKVNTVLAGGFSRVENKASITSVIEADHSAPVHNPVLIIKWSDGYEISVDETAASSRFKSTLRDTLNLRCVNNGRIEKMWRWDTPWRCAGFYQALTQFYGNAPTLAQLGISRPSELGKTVFGHIAQAAPLTNKVA